MSARAEQLWEELCGLLRQEGALPLKPAAMTPAEIAAYVRRERGDARPWRFVWQYYYPCRYGDSIGNGLSDEEAAALIRSFRHGGAEEDEMTAAPAVETVPCGLCRKRPVPIGLWEARHG